MEPVKMAIHGSCVSRDIFSYDTERKFQVTEYIARNSIVSSVMRPLQRQDVSSWEDGDWTRRMVRINVEKSLFKRLKDSHAGFLLIDLIDERFPLNAIGDTCITWTERVKEYLPGLPQNIVHASKYSAKELKGYARQYCKRIHDIFPSERIILYRAKMLEKYVNWGGHVYFPTDQRLYARQMNEHTSLLYDVLERELRCHVVNMPEGAIASEANRWGLAPMHYDQQTYKRVLKNIEEIVEKVS